MTQFNWIALVCGIVCITWSTFLLIRFFKDKEEYKLKHFVEDLIAFPSSDTGTKPIVAPIIFFIVGVTGIIEQSRVYFANALLAKK